MMMFTIAAGSARISVYSGLVIRFRTRSFRKSYGALSTAIHFFHVPIDHRLIILHSSWVVSMDRQ